MKYSLIIPVYNRPDEVDELLQSLTEQRFKDFEVIVVEDGSAVPCKDVVEKYTTFARSPQAAIITISASACLEMAC